MSGPFYTCGLISLLPKEVRGILQLSSKVLSSVQVALERTVVVLIILLTI